MIGESSIIFYENLKFPVDSAKIKKRKQCEDYINIEDNKKLKFTKLNEEVSIDTDSASEEDGDDFIDVGDNISENEMNKESTQDMIEKSSSYISIDKSSDFKDELSYLTDTSSQVIKAFIYNIQS